jgi:UDP-N-acetylmuramoyl-tripeptide--D-alanyl-D-alanine ligase
MKPLTIQQIRQAVGGKPLTSIPPKVAEITAVCTDTRRMEPGSLFVALSGENFNGHEFLPDAAKGGAIAAIIEEAPSHDLPNLHLIGVKSTRQALGKLATHVRKQMRSKVIAVAGSNGKTSTKYLIDAALAGKLKGSISPKSFNNDIGVPLAIFPADPMQDYLVLEMGTNHPGEIKVLTDMAQPDIAVITSIGAEHLEFLGDLMGVRRENASIISGLNPRGTLVYNGDDPELASAVAPYPAKKLKFGFRLDVKNDLFATHVETLDNGVRFNLNNSKRSVFVPMLGRHTASNALAAIAVARSLRLSEEEIIQNLSVAHGPEMRLQRSDVAGVTVLNDAYNANPHSMKAAHETLAALTPKHRRVAILGAMRELGESSDRYHKEIGEFAAGCKLDLLVCVGKQANLIAESAERSAMPIGSICKFVDSQEAARGVLKILREGDLVLLKASRGMRLERVAEAIAHSEPKFFRKAAS